MVRCNSTKEITLQFIVKTIILNLKFKMRESHKQIIVIRLIKIIYRRGN